MLKIYSTYRFMFVLIATVFFLLSISAQASEAPKNTALPIDQMRATVYTKAFAKRFALPDPELGTEPEGGIQAMEFAVEDAKARYPHKRFATYQCVLKLYIDSSLPVAYPEEGIAGSHHLLIQPSHFFMWPNPDNKRWLSFSEKDRLHFNERNSRYNRTAFLATPDYRWKPGGDISTREGFAAGMFYEEYHRDLFPGLAYLKIDTTCPSYSSMEKLEVIQVWLKREGGRDYRKQLREEPEDFLKFTIPQPFYRKILPWFTETARYNAEIINRKTNGNLKN